MRQNGICKPIQLECNSVGLPLTLFLKSQAPATAEGTGDKILYSIFREKKKFIFGVMIFVLTFHGYSQHARRKVLLITVLNFFIMFV